MTKHYQQRKAANERYLQKLDSIIYRTPKGRKKEIATYAAAAGKSVNGLITDLVRQEMGMTEEEWNAPAEEPEAPEEKEP